MPTIPASFLTFGTSPLYPIYGSFPRISGMDALTDQFIAGLTMKIVGGLILWAVIAVIFFRWGREETSDGRDATSCATSTGRSARRWADERCPERQRLLLPILIPVRARGDRRSSCTCSRACCCR